MKLIKIWIKNFLIILGFQAIGINNLRLCISFSNKSYNNLRLSAILTYLFLSSCTSPTTTKEASPCTYPAGNRSFTWRIDTVGWYPSSFGGLHAFSDNDAYAGGRFVTKDHSKLYNVLHWNGETWIPIVFSNSIEQLGNDPYDATGDGHFMVMVGTVGFENPRPGIGEYNNQTKQWKGYQFQTEGALQAVWTDKQGYFIAVGDNGTVYEKDGYNANWVYYQIESQYNFYDIAGVSKNEIYLLGHKYLWVDIGGEVGIASFNQVWKYNSKSWKKLFDDKDTTGMSLKAPIGYGEFLDIGAVRCIETDKLKLYLVGWESILYESEGHKLDFKMTNLSTMGLYLRQIRKVAKDIFILTPNDIWITGQDNNYFHWDGNSFQKVDIPALPSNNLAFSSQRRFFKTKTGKLFIPSETTKPQEYFILQGIPQ